mgnify:CR=1 FL=1
MEYDSLTYASMEATHDNFTVSFDSQPSSYSSNINFTGCMFFGENIE